MKVLLPLLALALMLAGCTAPTESDDGDADGDGNVTGQQRGGEVSGQMTVTQPDNSTSSAGNNSTTGS